MIYHYTSAETLALILKTRTIRFTRMDLVDDVVESAAGPIFDFAKYFFVSCWTTEQEENLMQWQMYASGMTGVRLGLPRFPFQRRRVTQYDLSHFRGLTMSKNALTPVAAHRPTSAEDDRWIAATPLQVGEFGGPVRYHPNPEELKRNALGTSELPNCVKLLDHCSLARDKSNRWAFQQEYRFHLIASCDGRRFGVTEFDDKQEGIEVLHQNGQSTWIPGYPPSERHIDLRITESSLRHIEVVTGPLCSKGTYLLVEAVLAQHAPGARLRRSNLSGAVRSRSAASAA